MFEVRKSVENNKMLSILNFGDKLFLLKKLTRSRQISNDPPPPTLFLSSACSASFDCASIQRGRRSCDFLSSCRPFLRNSRLLLIAHSSQCNFFWLVQSDFPSFRARRTLWILPYTVSRSESLNSVKIFSHS